MSANTRRRPAAQEHSATSVAAAWAMYEESTSLRAKVFRFLASRGYRGATDGEIQEVLDMDPSTERPRRIELLDHGHIKNSGATRRTASGHHATVWRVRYSSEPADPPNLRTRPNKRPGTVEPDPPEARKLEAVRAVLEAWEPAGIFEDYKRREILAILDAEG